MLALLKGKTAVVTGSTSGIGLGIARALAAQGAAIMLNGFGDAREIEEIRAGLQRVAGVPAAYSPADMTKPEEIAGLIADAEAELGPVDILVNNAGIQHLALVEDFPPEKWDAVLAINLSSSFHAIRAALPGMKKRGWGRIVNVASVLTPLVQKQIDALAAREKLSGDAARRKLLAEKQPSGEFATPEQIGGIAVFLCSPAADQVTGASLSVDGGWTAQ